MANKQSARRHEVMKDGEKFTEKTQWLTKFIFLQFVLVFAVFFTGEQHYICPAQCKPARTPSIPTHISFLPAEAKTSSAGVQNIAVTPQQIK